MKHDEKGLVKDWKNGEDIHRFDWDLSLLSKDLYKIRDFKEHMMKLMLTNGWIATHFKAEQDRVGSWEERYWQCVTIDWNCIEFYNLLELGREESGREDAGQWIVASFGELNFLHRTKLEWFHDIKLLHCLSLIIDSSTKACRTGEAWGERSSLELGDNGHTSWLVLACLQRSVVKDDWLWCGKESILTKYMSWHMMVRDMVRMRRKKYIYKRLICVARKGTG